MLCAIIGKAIKPAIAGGVLRPRLIEGKAKRLLVVFDDHTTERTAMLKLPACYTKATDLFTGADRPLANGSVKLTVSFQDAAVLLLE